MSDVRIYFFIYFFKILSRPLRRGGKNYKEYIFFRKFRNFPRNLFLNVSCTFLEIFKTCFEIHHKKIISIWKELLFRLPLFFNLVFLKVFCSSEFLTPKTDSINSGALNKKLCTFLVFLG